MLVIIARFEAKPEKVEELVALLNSFVEPTRAEAGCFEYHCQAEVDNPNKFAMYEVWRSPEDFDKHLSEPYLADFWARRLEYFVADVEMVRYRMVSPYEKG